MDTMSTKTFAVPWYSRIGLEFLFVILAVFSLVFMFLGGVWGLLNVLVIPLGRDTTKAYKPWNDVADIARTIGKHLKYLYRLDFLPWKQEMVQRRAAAQAERLRQPPDRVEFRQVVASPDFDAIDVVTLFALMPYLVPTLIILPHAILAAVTVISVYQVIPHYGVAELSKRPEPKVKIAFAPTVADQQEADYGPWWSRGEVIDRVGTRSFLNLALISDTGTVKYSQHLVGKLEGFQTMKSEKIVSQGVSPGGQIVLMDQHHRDFYLNPGQVFLFENFKAQAFVFTDLGELKAVQLKDLKTKEIQ